MLIVHGPYFPQKHDYTTTRRIHNSSTKNIEENRVRFCMWNYNSFFFSRVKNDTVLSSESKLGMQLSIEILYISSFNNNWWILLKTSKLFSTLSNLLTFIFTLPKLQSEVYFKAKNKALNYLHGSQNARRGFNFQTTLALYLTALCASSRSFKNLRI